MTLIVEKLSRDDIPAYSRLYNSVFATDDISRAMFPNGRTPASEEAGIQRDLAAFDNDPSMSFLCVRDTEDSSRDMLAVAAWKVIDEDHPVPQLPHDETPDGNEAAMARFFGGMAKLRKDMMAGKKKYWNLSILTTNPKHQRKGAGSMLIKWGLDRADEEGLEASLEASEAGKPLYEKFGFEEVAVDVMPLQEYGVDGTRVTAGMLRQSKHREAE